MPHYNSEPRDWFGGKRGIRLPSEFRTATRQYGIRTLQQGVTQFSRKKKNGNRLCSQAQIKASIAKNQAQIPVATCKLAFTKINLKNPADSPKVVVAVKAPPKTQPIPKGEKFCLNTMRS